MDINVLRETITVLSFVTFIGIVAFAALPGNESRFEEAARIPLDDEPSPQPSPKGEGANAGQGFENGVTGR